jgi:hypothetical protein
VPRTDGGKPRDTVEPSPGEQLLVEVDPLSDGLAALPPAAFENLLVVAVDLTPADVERAVRRQGRDPSAVGVVPVRGDSGAYEGSLWTAEMVSPNDLTGLSIQTSRGMDYLEPGRGWLVLSGLGVLVVYAGAERVQRFVDQLSGVAREQSLRGVYVLGADSVDREVGDALEAVLDGRVSLAGSSE